MAGITVITFDLDNTLWDANSVLLNAEQEMRGWLDEYVPEYNSTFNREAMLKLRTAMVAQRPALAHDLSAMREALLFEAISICGYGEKQARQHAATAFGIFYEARQRVVFYDDALDVLEQLAGRYQLGALTNGNASVEKIGLDHYFSFAFSSADVGTSKPAPDMFHAALAHCDVNPDQGIHVGDNLVDDIQGAGSVGMHTIWTNHRGAIAPVDTHQPSATVANLADLPRAIAAICDD